MLKNKMTSKKNSKKRLLYCSSFFFLLSSFFFLLSSFFFLLSSFFFFLFSFFFLLSSFFFLLSFFFVFCFLTLCHQEGRDDEDELFSTKVKTTEELEKEEKEFKEFLLKEQKKVIFFYFYFFLSLFLTFSSFKRKIREKLMNLRLSEDTGLTPTCQMTKSF